MAVTRQKKEDILKELVQLFADAKSVSFGQYAGMSVSDLQTMRREMRTEGVQFKVAKKTLFKLAAQENGIELPDEIMEGTVGAAFSFDDVVAGPKLLKKTSKSIEVVQLMGGVMEGKVLTITQMKELADLPSKEELLAKFVGMLQGPLRSFHGVLSGPTSSMARAFTAYAEQLPAEDAPVAEAPAKEEKAEEPAAEAPAKADEKSEEAAPAAEPAAEEAAETPEEAKAEEAPAEAPAEATEGDADESAEA